MSRIAPLYGRIFIEADIRTVTGLHIGGSEADFKIGTRDKVIIRDPITNKPYIPGSSLRGKMRSLLEKAKKLEQNHRINKGYIHVCKNAKDFQKCPVCSVFGIPAPSKPKEWGDVITLSRLVVRDVMLSKEGAEKLMAAHTDGLFTEFKTEVAIDRVTSVANPRTIERVPAGVTFGRAELIFSVYKPEEDIAHLKVVLEALQLVEDDYLGGNGSRGYGKVTFEQIGISLRTSQDYTKKQPIAEYPNLTAWADEYEKFQEKVRRFFLSNGG